MDFPRRVFDGEGVKADVDFGPTLMLNRNRCILCTRCVRFMQRDRRRRADRHRRSRLRQRDRHVRGGGRALAALGQPDGRLPGRRDHDARLPLQERARGTTRSAVDTICTLCAKGCNTTAWLKAKPEWAKGAQLIRMTPRFNPDVNGYWMCDIGRFDYHWIEGDDAPARPLLRQGRRASCRQARRGDAASARRAAAKPAPATRRRSASCVSAHASHEELFVLQAARAGPARRRRRSTASPSAGRAARSRSRPTPSSRCRRPTRRT